MLIETSLQDIMLFAQPQDVAQWFRQFSEDPIINSRAMQRHSPTDTHKHTGVIFFQPLAQLQHWHHKNILRGTMKVLLTVSDPQDSHRLQYRQRDSLTAAAHGCSALTTSYTEHWSVCHICFSFLTSCISRYITWRPRPLEQLSCAVIVHLSRRIKRLSAKNGPHWPISL